jgi:hypothetical protein
VPEISALAARLVRRPPCSLTCRVFCWRIATSDRPIGGASLSIRGARPSIGWGLRGHAQSKGVSVDSTSSRGRWDLRRACGGPAGHWNSELRAVRRPRRDLAQQLAPGTDRVQRPHAQRVHWGSQRLRPEQRAQPLLGRRSLPKISHHLASPKDHREREVGGAAGSRTPQSQTGSVEGPSSSCAAPPTPRGCPSPRALSQGSRTSLGHVA